jgi:RNA polymerase sigma-70 factor (ECF subfamily)
MPSNPFRNSLPPTSSLSDAELVEEIRSGNRELLNELYNRYASKIYYKSLAMVKDASQAQDMAHDIFVKVATNLHKYKGTADLSFWIYAITYNHCLSYLLKAKRLRFDPIKEAFSHADEGDLELTEKVVRDLQLTQLKKFIKKLKPNEEIILLMRYQEGMSIKQIASILQIGESAAKMRIARVRNRLAKRFKELEHE